MIKSYQIITFNLENLCNFKKVKKEILKFLTQTKNEIKNIFILLQEYSSHSDKNFDNKFRKFISKLGGILVADIPKRVALIIWSKQPNISFIQYNYHLLLQPNLFVGEYLYTRLKDRYAQIIKLVIDQKKMLIINLHLNAITRIGRDDFHRQQILDIILANVKNIIECDFLIIGGDTNHRVNLSQLKKHSLFQRLFIFSKQDFDNVKISCNDLRRLQQKLQQLKDVTSQKGLLEYQPTHYFSKMKERGWKHQLGKYLGKLPMIKDGAKIDILISNMKVKDTSILPTDSSDHSMVVSELLFEDKKISYVPKNLKIFRN